MTRVAALIEQGSTPALLPCHVLIGLAAVRR
jgi:hypothetical protein